MTGATLSHNDRRATGGLEDAAPLWLRSRDRNREVLRRGADTVPITAGGSTGPSLQILVMLPVLLLVLRWCPPELPITTPRLLLESAAVVLVVVGLT